MAEFTAQRSLGPLDFSLRPLSSAEVQIYQLLNHILSVSTIILDANFVARTTPMGLRSSEYYLRLKKCPQEVIVFEVDRSSGIIKDLHDEGSTNSASALPTRKKYTCTSGIWYGQGYSRAEAIQQMLNQCRIGSKDPTSCNAYAGAANCRSSDSISIESAFAFENFD